MPRYPSIFTTPEAVILQLDKANPNITPNPSNPAYNDFFAFVRRTCREASEYIENQTDRTFVPYRDDREYFHRDLADDDLLRYGRMGLLEDMLVCNTVTWEGGALETQIVSPTYYRFMPVNVCPSITIRFDMSRVPTFVPQDFNATTTISAWWGYHSNLSAAYTVMQTAFTCTENETDVTVTPGTGVLYETFQYLRCEDELMLITAIDTDDDTLTVERGVNGTTAVAHAAVELKRWNVIPDMALCATRLVAYLYQKRNEIGVVQYADGSTVIDKMPPAVKETIELYTRRVWMTA